MKIRKLCYPILAIFLLSACGDDLMNPVPLIEIDPGFATSGFYNATSVSQNESEKYTIEYNRVHGISRELSMSFIIDEASLEKYNEDNGTSYQLLPSEYYSITEGVKFDIKSKKTSFEMTLYSKKLYLYAGSVEAASNYLLPINSVTTETKGVDISENKNTLLVHVNMKSSAITVSTSAPTNLYLSKDSEIKETISVTGALNFTGIDPNTVSMFVDTQAPLLSTGEYTLLPEENYSFSVDNVKGSGNITVKGEINATGLTEDKKYLLPCRLQSSNSDYLIVQEDPVYYIINISDLKVSITEASASETVETASCLNILNSSVNVTTNTIVSSDLSINFNYDPSLISAFNTNSGTNYQTLPEGTVTIENGKVAIGSKTANIPYSIDLSDIDLSNDVHYLVPFVLNEGNLETGTISGSNTIYLDIIKSLAGTYKLNITDNARSRNIGNVVWDASKCQRAGDTAWDAVIADAQYGFNGDGDWYVVLFSVTDEDMTGKENCKKIKIHTFLELLEENGGTNKVTENKSYFNTLTGEVYIDCYVYESWFEKSYKETYSFTLE
ncbi:hypothetical protein BZG01_04480 [Labilibaculum manganireducens]|uniref:BT-3987-like N-terminal domain-containing protein n=1 Tax=Labilibaculum manganireducens TaxID=1940525 RepID=A0A2N3IDP6_9BACT|nr:DUF1735 domain-containing protein [Labilibaculum manganireducens]PKQ68474.1 hypothetical protein BZG01_04480 [Labilibaculum manganireducens]